MKSSGSNRGMARIHGAVFAGVLAIFAPLLSPFHTPQAPHARGDTRRAVYCDGGGSFHCMNVPRGHAVPGQRLNMWGHPGTYGCSGCTPFEEWSLDDTGLSVNGHWPFRFRAVDAALKGGRLVLWHYRGNGARPSRPQCATDQPRHIYFAALERCSKGTRWVRWVVNNTIAYISVAAVNRGKGAMYAMTAACNRDGCPLKLAKLVQGGVGIWAAVNADQDFQECLPTFGLEYTCQQGKKAS